VSSPNSSWCPIVQGLIVNFAISYTIIGVLMGITGLYSLGFAYGGPVSVIWGWFTVGIFSMFIAASMAEICSSLPVSLQSMGVLSQLNTQTKDQWQIAFWSTEATKAGMSNGPLIPLFQGVLHVSKASGIPDSRD
jgi:hypothetical protein